MAQSSKQWRRSQMTSEDLAIADARAEVGRQVSYGRKTTKRRHGRSKGVRVMR